MITEKTEIFEHFCINNIYLTDEAISDCIVKLKEFKKLEGAFKAVYLLEDYVFKNYKNMINKKNAAFQELITKEKKKYNEHEKWCEKVSTKIDKIDENGSIISSYKSVYSAAIELGKGKNAVGNITNAIKLNRKAYGFNWKVSS